MPDISLIARSEPVSKLSSLPSRFRAGFRLLRVGTHLAYGVATVALLYPILSLKRRLYLKQRWSQQLLSMLGVKLHLPNRASLLPGSGLLVANHVSWLDIFVINACLPAAFVSKEEVRTWPFIGWLCARTDTVFLERGNRRAAQRTTAHIQHCLREGQRVAVFPEGTTSDGSAVLPFHGALLQSAIESACLVQAVALCYQDDTGRRSTAPVYAGDTPLGQSLWTIACSPSLHISPQFLPVTPAAGGDRRRLAAMLHQQITLALSVHRPVGDEPSISPMGPENEAVALI